MVHGYWVGTRLVDREDHKSTSKISGQNKSQVKPMEPMHRSSAHPDTIDWETRVHITRSWDFSLGLWILTALCLYPVSST